MLLRADKNAVSWNSSQRNFRCSIPSSMNFKWSSISSSTQLPIFLPLNKPINPKQFNAFNYLYIILCCNLLTWCVLLFVKEIALSRVTTSDQGLWLWYPWWYKYMKRWKRKRETRQGEILWIARERDRTTWMELCER